MFRRDGEGEAASAGSGTPVQNEDTASVTTRPSDQPAPVASAGASSGQEFCDVTEAFENAADCNRFKQQLAAVRDGRHAFKPRQPMIRGQETIVRYAITRLPAAVQSGRGTADERREAIAGADAQLREEILPEGAEGPVATGAIQIGRQMYACLESDPSFTITPAECQTVDTLQHPEPVWRWGVTPNREGTYSLTLTSGIEVLAAGGDVRRIGQFSQTETIRVNVSTEGQRDDFLAWLESWIRSPLGVIAALTALVAAIGGLVVGARKLRGGGGAG